MKIVKLLGGLGNQMFQYAFFLSLLKNNISIKIDNYDFENYNLHQGFELSKVFNIQIENFIASKEEIVLIKDNDNYFNIRKIIGRLLFSNPNKFLKETHFIQPNYSVFHPQSFEINDKYFDGYWQSAKYFAKIEKEIMDLFSWKDIPNRNFDLSKKMESENSIAVHIRRFDKLKNIKQFAYQLKLRMLWRVCSKKYYIDSISYLETKFDNPKFYIFTDNINWVKENLPITSNYLIIDWNRNHESHWDMYLMTKCKHNIISMSSFSWWGAWLNQNPNKLVVAPKKWALRFSKDIDLIPTSWIRI